MLDQLDPQAIVAIGEAGVYGGAGFPPSTVALRNSRIVSKGSSHASIDMHVDSTCGSGEAKGSEYLHGLGLRASRFRVYRA